MQTRFRTPISIKRNPLLDQGTSILTAGSCFADNLGERLKAFKWPCRVNPFGTQFHPLGLFDLLGRACRREALPEDAFLDWDGSVFHYALSGKHFASSREALAADFEGLSSEVRTALAPQNSILMLTFGTAWVFEKDGRWVSNCHQQPGHLFQKRLLSLDEMLDAAAGLLRDIPAHVRILLTLSPVRHTRLGLAENSLSKSLLRVLIHEMQRRWPDRSHYFPAYEIVMDDLRDYRFFESDMVHPNESAIDYIWELFVQSLLTPEAEAFVAAFTPILRRLEHRSLRPSSPSQRTFQEKLLCDLQTFPEIDLSQEIAKVRKEWEESGG